MMRRSLTHVGGATETRGRPEIADALARAFDVESSVESDEAEDAARAHVHGFHTYAARLHPATARHLVRALSAPGDAVLDPFCGSGTVLVEARLLQRRALGVDANPLAIRLARFKTEPADDAFLAALSEGAARVASVAQARRKAKAGASRRYGEVDVASFAPHVLLELDGLRVGLVAETDPRVREALFLVLSSILVKMSKRSGDTSGGQREVRLAAGYPTRVFVKKTEELASRLAEIAPRLADGPRAHIVEGDARDLSGIKPASADLVVTSPPYPGVYDYAEQHALRLRWLGLAAGRFEEAEIGARRRARAEAAPDAIAAYAADMKRVLAAIATRLRPGGRAAIVAADGSIGGLPVWMDDLLASLGEEVGLTPLAVASQERPHFDGATSRAFRDRPRREHVAALELPSARRR
jgi:SAM-dependent methyltransferase